MIWKKPKAGVEITATAHIAASGDGAAVLCFSGDWLLSERRSPFSRIERFFAVNGGISKLTFDTSSLAKYDSALISFLFRCYEICAQKNVKFDMDSLPAGPRSLLELAVAVPEAGKGKKGESGNIIGKLGSTAIDALDAFKAQATFVGLVTIALYEALRRRARYRVSDLLLIIQKSGPEALPIVALISFLVGLILGFVGVIQLAKYGSEIFVADLVGIAMVRELGAIMVAIVMAGRTGAAFAAELASMKVNEEISAYRTFGISPMEFLVIPRIIALTLMFPLLTIFADAIALMGGMVVSVGLSDVSMDQYINRTISALTLVQCSTGVGKSIVFGFIVAAVGCRMGMQAQTSSEGVGMATTSSVVESIKLIIITDAIFAIIFVIFGI